MTLHQPKCEFPQWKHDGFCDDGNNHAYCDFDGGDCCGSCINTKYCVECECLDDDFYDVKSNGFLADGFCDDINNDKESSYDGRDCCGLSKQTNFCINCTCIGKL